MHFDLETLYELHYQMITLGKVGCFLVVPFVIGNTAKASQSIIFRNHHRTTSDFMTGYSTIEQVLARTIREGQATRYLRSLPEKVIMDFRAEP